MKDYQKLKETLKEKADLLAGEHQMLFGDKFQHYITKTVKTSQKSEELLKSMGKYQVQIAELHKPAFRNKALHVKVY